MALQMKTASNQEATPLKLLLPGPFG